MKKLLLFFILFIVSQSFSQSINDFKAVIIPMKYDFVKTENQYRLQTITKLNLQKAGFIAFYAIESTPTEFNDKCQLLYLDVIEDKGFLITKLFITFRDCKGTIIYKSDIGKSKEKEYKTAFVAALNEAFKSVYALNYKYRSTVLNTTKTPVISEIVPVESTIIIADKAVITPIKTAKKEETKVDIQESKGSNLLYAQPTSYGYQLIDNQPKVVMKVYRTSNATSYIATKGSIQGVLNSKNNQWIFEYYLNEKLISEEVEVKF